MIRSNYLSMEFWERLSKLSVKCGTAIFDYDLIWSTSHGLIDLIQSANVDTGG